MAYSQANVQARTKQQQRPVRARFRTLAAMPCTQQTTQWAKTVR